MADFNFITPRLATGGAIKTADDVVALIAAGITYVIDTWEEEDFSHVFEGTPITNLRNVTLDDGTPKPPEWFARSITPALEALKGSPNARVLAHCAGGINRGPSTAYAILRAGGLSASIAENLIRRARPQVQLRYMHDADAAIVSLGYAK